MNAKNQKEVISAYKKFAWFLFFTIAFTVFAFWAFMKTAIVDDAQIQVKKVEYDKIINKIYKISDIADNISEKLQQIKLSDVENTAISMNNEKLLKNIKDKVLDANIIIDSMDNRDCLLYKKLFERDINVIQDSIDNFIRNSEQIAKTQKQLEECYKSFRRR